MTDYNKMLYHGREWPSPPYTPEDIEWIENIKREVNVRAEEQKVRDVKEAMHRDMFLFEPVIGQRFEVRFVPEGVRWGLAEDGMFEITQIHPEIKMDVIKKISHAPRKVFGVTMKPASLPWRASEELLRQVRRCAEEGIYITPGDFVRGRGVAVKVRKFLNNMIDGWQPSMAVDTINIAIERGFLEIRDMGRDDRGRKMVALAEAARSSI